MANKYFYIKGGAETYHFSLRKLLQEKGHEVVDFSMKDDRNLPSDYSDYFVENIDYHTKHGMAEKFRLAKNIVYSGEAKARISKLLELTKPDLVHLNNFHHQLSPSILYAIKKDFGIPVVYTAHDLKLVCGNYKMLSKGRVCESCRNKRYYKCFVNRCVKASYGKSLVNTVEMYVHSIMKSNGLIDAVISPSAFYRNKLVEFGISGDRIVTIPNYIDAGSVKPCYSYGNYFIFLGRLSEEKGLHTLLDAMKQIEGAVLKIIGTGPLEDEVNRFIHENGMEGKVELTGYKTGHELEELIRHAMFSVMPSEWYENSPYSLLETMACGKPSIGSAIAGIPELIEHGRNGLVFRPSDVGDLAGKINFLLHNREKIREFGENARNAVELKYNPEVYYSKLIEVYERVKNENCNDRA